METTSLSDLSRFSLIGFVCSAGSFLAPGASLNAVEPIHYIASLGDGVLELTNTGYSIGGDASSSPPDYGTWLARPDGSLLALGFRDPLHTGSDGRRSSGVLDVNNGGVTIGGSSRYSGLETNGESAWICDRHGNVVKIGFYDAAHTGYRGLKLSRPLRLNESNQAIGYSMRSGGYFSQSAWLATSTGWIRRIGIWDASHTSAEGLQFSYPVALNDSGYVAGYSTHYPSLGRTTWLYQPWGALRVVGFQSGVHRSASGDDDNEVKFLTNSGYMGGEARRYRPGTDEYNGTTAWVTRVDGPNRPVGLFDPRHLAPTGRAESVLWDVNERGTSIGTSGQVAEGDPGFWGMTGRSAWIARASGETIRVGLYDAEHTIFGGFQWQSVFGLNENDIAIGESAFGGTFPVSSFGYSAWVADLATGMTTRIGLIDAAHTRADGYRVSSPQGLTESRYVSGISYRYADQTPDGSVPFTTWLYDRISHTYTIVNQLPGTPPGFATSRVLLTYVDDSGVIIGSYDLLQWGVASRGFIYEPGGGFRHLDEAVDIDISTEGFSRFSAPRLATPTGFIAGDGVLAANPLTGRRVYLLRR